MHAAKLRIEIAQSRSEQNEYLRNVELARLLNKRAERKVADKTDEIKSMMQKSKRVGDAEPVGAKSPPDKKRRTVVGEESGDSTEQLSSVLGNLF